MSEEGRTRTREDGGFRVTGKRLVWPFVRPPDPVLERQRADWRRYQAGEITKAEWLALLADPDYYTKEATND